EVWRVESFREDGPSPERRRVFRHIAVGGKAPCTTSNRRGRAACGHDAVERMRERRQIVSGREAFRANPDLVGQAPRGLAEIRRLANGCCECAPLERW